MMEDLLLSKDEEPLELSFVGESSAGALFVGSTGFELQGRDLRKRTRGEGEGAN